MVFSCLCEMILQSYYWRLVKFAKKNLFLWRHLDRNSVLLFNLLILVMLYPSGRELEAFAERGVSEDLTNQ